MAAPQLQLGARKKTTGRSMTKISVYGIPNCDTVKKARAWLDAKRLDYTFHDYKKEGADAAKLAEWSDAVGWEPLLNRRGTTFRALSDADKTDIDRDKAIRLMEASPSLIKRPDRKSTRLNSSHVRISYAVFCLKKKKKKNNQQKNTETNTSQESNTNEQ